MDARAQITVEVPRQAALQAQALQVLLGDEAQVQQLLEAAGRGMLDLSGLFSAQTNEAGCVAAVWVVVQPGGIAGLQVGGERFDTAAVAGRIHHALQPYLDRRQVQVVQSLIAADDVRRAAFLQGWGWSYLTDIRFLISLGISVPPDELPDRLQYVPFRPVDRPRLERLIEQTGHDSLDCPEVNGLRRPAEIVDSFLSSPQGATENWWLAMFQGRDIGCVLMSPVAEGRQNELAYVGVIPRERGKSFGQELVRRAQQVSARQGRPLLVAVDARNRPALNLYERARFLQWDVRQLYVCQRRG